MKKLIITLSVFASVLTTVSAEEIKIDSLTLNKGLYDSRNANLWTFSEEL